MTLRKYPRTRHIQGSRLQPGDHDLAAVDLSELAGSHVVVEEKIDGANAALSFEGRELRLQSRGHYLVGGRRERHFALLKTWAQCHRRRFEEVLGERYVMFGEWVYAKHTVFYDALPHYFLEFDVLDRDGDRFLDTPSRAALLEPLPVVSVPVLYAGEVTSVEQLRQLVQPSRFKSANWKQHLRTAPSEWGSSDDVIAQTDPSDLAEGLYLKAEADGVVLGRYKWVRASFLTVVADSKSHWLNRPIVPNRLAPEVDIYAV